MMRPIRQPLPSIALTLIKTGVLGSVAMSGVWLLPGIEPSQAQGLTPAGEMFAGEMFAQRSVTQVPTVDPAPIDIPVETVTPGAEESDQIFVPGEIFVPNGAIVPDEPIPGEPIPDEPIPGELIPGDRPGDFPGDRPGDFPNERIPEGTVVPAPVEPGTVPSGGARVDSAPPERPSRASSTPSNLPPGIVPVRVGSSFSRSSVRDRYQLDRGDRISIEVFDAPEYSGEQEITPDGSISIDLVGTFQLRGLTLAQAETLIANRLANILRRPFTTIRLLEQRPLNLAVTGEVHEPGAYTLTLAEADGIPTVTKAIQLAEGIRLTADIRNIQVRRTNPATNRIDQVLLVDLWDLVENGDLSQDIPLEDGDSIVIPEADALSYDELNVLAYANISPDEMTVNVVGEVEAPGAIQVKPNTPLHQAILAAGGFNSNRAKKKEVLLIRLNPDGTVLNQEIEIDFEQGIDPLANPPLRPFDTIVVGRSNFTRVTDILGQALSPLSGLLGIFRFFGL